MHRVKTFLQSKWTRAITVAMLIAVPFVSVQAALFAPITILKDSILYIISWVLYFILIGVMGYFATLATELLVYTAQLNNFTDLPVIVEIWQVSRDLTNMFFIVILLVIAFGTLFRMEAYSWKKLLPKMILAAILVNYSRAICGFIVDASQIVMLTFVAAIKDAAAVGLSSAFQLDKLLQFGATNSALAPGEVGSVTSPEQRLVAIIAAGFMLATMFTVQCVYIVVLVGRLVMIWFLTALSPFRAGAMVLPQTERYASQYDETFIRYVVVGIMAAASLWFSMFVAAKAIDSGGLGSIAASEEVKKIQLQDEAASGALDTTLISGFIIATMMLMLGMKLTQENASELGGSIGKVSGLAGGFTKLITVTAGMKALGRANDWQAMKTGYDLNLPRSYKSWQHGLDTTRRWRENQIAATAGARHRQGNLLAGALGAGDQVVETGVTLDQLRGFGTPAIPFIGSWLSSKGIGLSKEARFRRALDKEQQANGTQATAESNLNSLKAKHRKGLMTNEEFARQEQELTNVLRGAVDIDDDYQKDKGAKEFDASNKQQRAMIEMRISNLQESLSDPALSDAQKESNANEAAALQRGLAMGKFKQADIGVDMTRAVEDYRENAREAAQAHLDNKDDATNFGKLHTQADIQKYIADQADVKAAQSAYNAAEHDSHAAHLERHTLGPEMGSAWESKFRAAVNEEGKKIKTTDASALLDGFIDALETGKGIEMAAWYEKLCETGNDNEPYKALGLEFNAKGAGDLAKIMQEKTGLTQQAVLSTMYQGAQYSENLGHTPVAQLYDVKSGEIVQRPLELQIAIAQGEEAKKDQKRHQVSATRLRTGEMSEKYVATERRFTRRTIKNIIPTSGTDGKSHTNPNFLTGLMKNAQRWKEFQEDCIDELGPEVGREAIKRIKAECRDSGISLPS